ncbi:MAG: FkbM family methyltransferase [Bacteroidetes bacterium]|nr:FkbM family methyltransferase [Bacteroidota bacterium]
MNKLKTYSRYFYEYLKHWDILSIIASARYLIFKTSHKKDRIIQTSIGKFFCRKNTNDFQYANYRYEWGVKKFVLDNKHKFNVFIDGGACVGEYCILLTKLGVRCIAFEPVIQNYDVLKKNLELNNLSASVIAFPYGLGEREMKAPFYFNRVNTGASHIITDAKTPDCLVEIRTFDSLLPQMGLKHDDRILVKLDVEGMEPEAILGAAGFISRFPNITFVAEGKHSGDDLIKNALKNLASFDFGIVDEFNIYATKKQITQSN